VTEELRLASVNEQGQSRVPNFSGRRARRRGGWLSTPAMALDRRRDRSTYFKAPEGNGWSKTLG